MCTIFNAVIMSLFLPAVYPHSWTTQQGLELSHRARLEHDDEDDECVDLGGWQVEPRIVRIASIRLGESNSSTALGLEAEFCDKPGNSYFCWDCSVNKVNKQYSGKKDKGCFWFCVCFIHRKHFIWFHRKSPIIINYIVSLLTHLDVE